MSQFTATSDGYTKRFQIPEFTKVNYVTVEGLAVDFTAQGVTVDVAYVGVNGDDIIINYQAQNAAVDVLSGGSSYDDTAVLASISDLETDVSTLDADKADKDVTIRNLTTDRSTTSLDDGGLLLNKSSNDYTITVAENTIPNGCLMQATSTGTIPIVAGSGVTVNGVSTVEADELVWLMPTDVANTYTASTLTSPVGAAGDTAEDKLFKLKLIASNYLSGNPTADSLQNHGLPTDRIEMVPFIVGGAFNCTELGVNVVTGLATSVCKGVVYNTDANGAPSTVLAESPEMDCSTSGYKGAAVDIDFVKGLYWIGVKASGAAATINGVNRPVAINLGQDGPIGTWSSNILCAVRYNEPYGTAAPDNPTTDNDSFRNFTPPMLFVRTS